MTGGTWWLGAGLAVVLAAACAPQSIEFEHTDGGAGRLPDDGVGGTAGAGGGTGGAGGTQSGSTGGTSSGAGRPGQAGTGGGTTSPDPELDTSCDYETVITTDCAKGGCHKGALAAANLNLTPGRLVANLKDVPATHLGIQCSAPTEPYMECIPASCPSAFRVDSANWEQSWVISKLRGTHGGCGSTMPDDTYRTTSPQREACLEAMVKAIAELPTP